MRRVIYAPYLKKKPIIDGEIRDEFWGEAYKFDKFKKYKGEGVNPESTQPSQRTIAYFGYDEENLYIAFKCYEEMMDKITVSHTSSKRPIILQPYTNLDDYVEIFIDPFHTHTNYFHLLVNPKGKIFSSSGVASWKELYSTPGWFKDSGKVAASCGDKYWSVTICIPFSSLGIKKPEPGHIMGINFQRERTFPAHETYFFMPHTLSPSTQWTSSIVYEPYRFGHLILGESLGFSQKRLEEEEKRLKEKIWNISFPWPEKEIEEVKRILPHKKEMQTSLWEIKKIKDRDFWIILPPFCKLPGLKEDVILKKANSFSGRKQVFWGFEKLYQIAFREVEIYDEKGENIAREAKVSSLKDYMVKEDYEEFTLPGKTEGLEYLTDGRKDKAATYTEGKFYPVEGWFAFIFSSPRKISKVILYHGIKIKGKINGIPVKFINIAEDFVLQYLDNKGIWKDIPGTRIKDNRSPITKLEFSPLETRGLRVYVFSQTFSAIDYSESDAWKWWFERDPEEGEKTSPLQNYLNQIKPSAEEKELERAPFYIEFYRYTFGDFLPEKRRKESITDLAYKSLKRKFKDTFLGFRLAEWDSDIWTTASGAYEHPWWKNYPHHRPKFPKDKKGSLELLKNIFLMQKKVLWDDVFGMNCWRTIDHYGLEWGGNFSFIELTPAGNPSYQIQIAFARGAARQYGKFWGAYLAFWFGVGTGGGVINYLNPTSKSFRNVRTSFSGPSVSLFKRTLYTVYFSGATLMDFEGPQGVMLKYSPKENKFSLSPHGKILREFLKYILKNPERGIPYTPVGILLDYYHGFSPPYQSGPAFGRSGLQTWFWTPYRKEDHMRYQIFYAIFPWTRQRIERNGFHLVNSPFGDIFDVLIAGKDLTEEILSHYRVILLADGIMITKKIRDTLKNYVKEGGVLICNSIHKGLGVEKGELIFEGEDGFKAFSSSIGKGKMIYLEPDYLLNKEGEILPSFKAFLLSLVKETLPFQVKGDIQYILNRTPEGWLVCLINNRGVYHLPSEAPILRKEDSEVEVIIPEGVAEVKEKITGEIFGKRIKLVVPSGEVRILEIKGKKW